MSFAAEGNSLEALCGGTGEAMNQKVFHSLHLAPRKPLQTEGAEKPCQRLGTEARLSHSLHCLQADRGKCSYLPLGQLHPRLLVPCLHTNLFLAALQVSAWPALGLVLSKPTQGGFNLDGSAAASRCVAVHGREWAAVHEEFIWNWVWLHKFCMLGCEREMLLLWGCIVF